jgi:hypothetical protein
VIPLLIGRQDNSGTSHKFIAFFFFIGSNCFDLAIFKP